jgi:hypothetical protein
MNRQCRPDIGVIGMSRLDTQIVVRVEGRALSTLMLLAWLDRSKLCDEVNPPTLGIDKTEPPMLSGTACIKGPALGIEEGPTPFQVGLCK